MLETRNSSISVNFNRIFRFKSSLEAAYRLFSTIFLVIMTLFLVMSCSTRSSYPAKKPNKSIEFGHGGGFAGKEYRYELLPDGRLFQKQSESYTFIAKIPSKTTSQLIANVDRLANQMLVIDEPGNTYQFLQCNQDEKKARWVWNSANQTNLGSLLVINHEILMELTKAPAK